MNTAERERREREREKEREREREEREEKEREHTVVYEGHSTFPFFLILCIIVRCYFWEAPGCCYVVLQLTPLRDVRLKMGSLPR